MLGGTQYFQPPLQGVWLLQYNLKVDRVGGGVFTGLVNTGFYYNNAANGILQNRQNVAGIATPLYVSGMDIYPLSGIGASINACLSYQHNDAVNHSINVVRMSFVRLSSYL
jgi:hypothetical protein